MNIMVVVGQMSISLSSPATTSSSDQMEGRPENQVLSSFYLRQVDFSLVVKIKFNLFILSSE